MQLIELTFSAHVASDMCGMICLISINAAFMFAATDLSSPLFAQEQRIGVEEYEALCKGTRNLTPPPITDELSRWVNETQWSALQPLTQLPVRAPNTTVHACIGSVH